MIRYAFITVTDHWFFPGTLATVNSIRAFHPHAEIFVVNNQKQSLSAPQAECFERCLGVKVIESSDFERSGRLIDAFELKAYACHDLSEAYDVLIGIDSDCLLCAGVDDVIEACHHSGGFFGGRDGDGVSYDSTYRPYGIATPAFNPAYMSTSLYFCAVTAENREVMRRWVECCNNAEFNGTGPCPGYLDQGVLNAVLFAAGRSKDVHLLPNELYSQHWIYWDSIIDFRDGQFINLSAGGARQRSFHCGGTDKFWTRGHRERVLDTNPLQTYPYLWFLAMMWFGECGSWDVDPYQYLAADSHHLIEDLVHFYPQIVQIYPRARELWERLSDVMIDRILDGIPRGLSLGGGSMSDVMALVEQNPDIRRYVELGSYEGGSILALALRFLNRDSDFFAVESFMGNMDGTMDGYPLPSRRRFLENMARFPTLRVTLVPGDSRTAASLFTTGTVDFVFIDACHETESVLRDIDRWSGLLRPGGILAGDDYSWPSVQEAVDRRWPSANVMSSGDVWWVRMN